jgi:hypothetical protein
VAAPLPFTSSSALTARSARLWANCRARANGSRLSARKRARCLDAAAFGDDGGICWSAGGPGNYPLAFFTRFGSGYCSAYFLRQMPPTTSKDQPAAGAASPARHPRSDPRLRAASHPVEEASHARNAEEIRPHSRPAEIRKPPQASPVGLPSSPAERARNTDEPALASRVSHSGVSGT